MFDLEATIRWTTAVLKDPDSVAERYRETGADWRRSFLVLTLPLYVVAFLVAGLIALVGGGSLPLGGLSFGALLLSLAWALGWTFVIAFVFDTVSGVFDGQRGFDAAYAVVALAIVPSALGAALAPLPGIGWLLSLAGGVYALVLAYRFLPVFLEIPETARGKHFALSIVAALLINLVVSYLLASTLAPGQGAYPQVDAGRVSSDIGSPEPQPGGAPVSGGIFGGFERQAELVEAATSDTYQPPASGRLTEAQVRAYVDARQKARVLEARLGRSLEELEDGEPSLSDVVSGVGGAMRLATAEMEVVKTAGGNWAEHQWVRGQLETARIQEDLNEVTTHNFALYQKYREALERSE